MVEIDCVYTGNIRIKLYMDQQMGGLYVRTHCKVIVKRRKNIKKNKKKYIVLTKKS